MPRASAGRSRSLLKISGNGVASQTSGSPGLRVNDGVKAGFDSMRFKGGLELSRYRWRLCFEWPDGQAAPDNVEIVDYHG